MNQQKRLRRAESFLGIHFDFHATDEDKAIGATTTREMVEYIIEQVQPDYVQCDCKGHPGFTSYPSQLGNAAPSIARDPLRIWREVTAERGVALYMHYSGVWDTQAIKQHPEWARVDEHGERDKDSTSLTGPYVDELLIPQLKELCDVYGVDGVWVDGDCWAARPDYSARSLERFRQQTGIDEVPRSPEDAHYAEFLAFCREEFRAYVRRYSDALHVHNPDFQVATNWAYSSFMPEEVNLPVDFISGDVVIPNSVNIARFEGRCFVHQGKPWDLMSWSFGGVFGGHEENDPFSTKSVPQLQREAAAVVALGGGFQAYFTQKRDGSISRWQMKLMHEVGEFCRARQPFCHRAMPVPQIGLLLATSTLYRQGTRVFGPWGKDLEPFQGVLQALLESQQAVDILMEHHLERLVQYPLVVVPEWSELSSEVAQTLRDYAQQGGKLLLIGPRTAGLFTEELGIVAKDEVQDNVDIWLEHNDWLGVLKTTIQQVQVREDAMSFGRWYDENDTTGQATLAASLRPYGQGRIAATYFTLGENYRKRANGVQRGFLAGLVRELFPDPLVTVSGSQYVDVMPMCLPDGCLAVNLLNTAGPHGDRNVYVVDDIPPVGPLQVSIQCVEAPRKVMLQPEGEALEFEYRDGRIELALPRLMLHTVIVVE